MNEDGQQHWNDLADSFGEHKNKNFQISRHSLEEHLNENLDAMIEGRLTGKRVGDSSIYSAFDREPRYSDYRIN